MRSSERRRRRDPSRDARALELRNCESRWIFCLPPLEGTSLAPVGRFASFRRSFRRAARDGNEVEEVEFQFRSGGWSSPRVDRG